MISKMQKKINKRRQKNNHARTKRRVKVLKLKMLSRRVMDSRYKKRMALYKTPGITIIGEAKKYATYIPPKVTKTKKGVIIYSSAVDYSLKGKLNQRQKRKIWRNAPHMRKTA